MGPFWNIWGLSWKVFVSFSDLPHCIIPVFEFFFLSKVLPITNQACSRYFCQRKTSIGSFRESLKPVFYHQSWKATHQKFQVDLATAFLSVRRPAHTTPTTPRLWPGPSLSSAAAAWRARACGSSKCPPRPAKIEPGEPHRNLSFKFNFSWVQVQVSSLHACGIVTTIDRRWLWPRGRHGGVFFCRFSPWLKAIAKFFKGIWVSRLWSCLGLRRSAALVTDSRTCDVFFTRWVLCVCFEEIENWWVLCCSIVG